MSEYWFQSIMISNMNETLYWVERLESMYWAKRQVAILLRLIPLCIYFALFFVNLSVSFHKIYLYLLYIDCLQVIVCLCTWNRSHGYKLAHSICVEVWMEINIPMPISQTVYNLMTQTKRSLDTNTQHCIIFIEACIFQKGSL